jgi:Ni,Fe-hydrogenase maturation factor
MFHHLDAGALLALAAYIGGKTPRAYVITVGAESFDYTEKLSATVAAVVPRVVETVRRLIHA